MGQLEVYEFLKDYPDRWYSCREISDGIAMSFPSTTIALMRMRKFGEVVSTGSGRSGDRYRYKFKN